MRMSSAPHFSAQLPACCHLPACFFHAWCLLAFCRYHGIATVLAPVLPRGSSFLSLGLHLKPPRLRASRSRPPQNPFSGEPTLPTLNDEEVSYLAATQARIRPMELHLSGAGATPCAYPLRPKGHWSFVPFSSPSLSDQANSDKHQNYNPTHIFY